MSDNTKIPQQPQNRTQEPPPWEPGHPDYEKLITWGGHRIDPTEIAERQRRREQDSPLPGKRARGW
jgi:hypothetical protein